MCRWRSLMYNPSATVALSTGSDHFIPRLDQKAAIKKKETVCAFFPSFVLFFHFFTTIISQTLCRINDLVRCFAGSHSKVRPRQIGERCLSKLFNSVHLISLQVIMVNLHYGGLSVAVCFSSHHYKPADTQTPCWRLMDTLPSMGKRYRPGENWCIYSTKELVPLMESHRFYSLKSHHLH